MDRWKAPVDVVCSNHLMKFKTRQMAKNFFFSCMTACEGAERDRYTNIYIGLEATNQKMVHDEDYYVENPIIFSVSEIDDDNTSRTKKKFKKPISYYDYIFREKFKKRKKLDLEI